MALRINNPISVQSSEEKAYLTEVHPIVNAPDRREEAIQALERFIDKYPNYAPAYNNLGVIYYETGGKDKALSLYKKAVEIDGANVSILKNLADFYLIEEGRLEDALKLYVNVLEIDNEDVETYLILGNICAQMGKIEDARFFFEKVLEIEPWNLTALDNMDYLDEINK